MKLNRIIGAAISLALLSGIAYYAGCYIWVVLQIIF